MFRTPLQVKTASQQISHFSGILTLGSCFADVMGSRLDKNKFRVNNNPFGVIFNPLSVFSLLQHVVKEELPSEDSYCYRDSIYFNYHLHSDFSSSKLNNLKDGISSAFTQTKEFLKNCDFISITLGTALVYELRDLQSNVANCHKMPASLFRKRLLEVNQILEAFEATHETLMSFNPSLRFILTVSPIRHIKDTLELNSVSKSTLRLACHQLEQKHDNVEYFPSFEIMMDDLRDYRFYERDMLHPTTQAEDYIWEAFGRRYFDAETQNLLSAWVKIEKSLKHRAFHPESEVHQTFLKKTLQKLEKLGKQLDLSTEIEELKQQLK